MTKQAHAPHEAAGSAAFPFNFRDRDGNPLPRDLADDALPTERELARAIQRRREDGWTPQRIRMFLTLLATNGNVRYCCRELMLSRESVYRLRRRNPVFARAWDGAMLRARESYIDECWQRAVVGSSEEVLVEGRLVERQIRPSDAMLRYLLNRVDKRADSSELSAQQSQAAELRLEDLIDCLDPERALPEDGDIPDEEELMEEIEATAQIEQATPKDAVLLDRFESHYRRELLKVMQPDDVTATELNPDIKVNRISKYRECADHGSRLDSIDPGDGTNEYEEDYEGACEEE